MCPSLPSLPLPLTWHPKQTWYLLVELNGISATLGFLSLIFLTEPQDSSMHLSRADSEASPAVSRCQQGEFSVTVEDQGGRALTSPRQPQGARGEAGRQQSGRAVAIHRPPTLDTEMFSCPALKTARLQRPAIRDRAVHVGDRLSKVAPGRKGERSRSLALL